LSSSESFIFNNISLFLAVLSDIFLFSVVFLSFIIKFSNNISKIKSKENKKVNEEIILDKENNINGQRKIIGRTTKNNDLILKIKDSLDDNLKHILNFSYENFLNKESERD
jgi:hypothetical protein